MITAIIPGVFDRVWQELVCAFASKWCCSAEQVYLCDLLCFANWSMLKKERAMVLGPVFSRHWETWNKIAADEQGWVRDYGVSIHRTGT